MFRVVLSALALCVASAGAVVAQASSSSADTAARRSPRAAAAADTTGAPNDERERAGGECFRFVFGEWKPPLDSKAAGHVSFPPADSLPQAPGGRDWAFSDSTASDLQLMLYPSFWPAGVSVRFPRSPHVPGDTVRGRALALVADGRVRSPEADAMAWLVPCGR